MLAKLSNYINVLYYCGAIVSGGIVNKLRMHLYHALVGDSSFFILIFV